MREIQRRGSEHNAGRISGMLDGMSGLALKRGALKASQMN
jgi:hypothetical protein